MEKVSAKRRAVAYNKLCIQIFFDLLKCERMTAIEIASKYGTTREKVYTAAKVLWCAGVPIEITKGSKGGLSIAKTYKEELRQQLC